MVRKNRFLFFFGVIGASPYSVGSATEQVGDPR